MRALRVALNLLLAPPAVLTAAACAVAASLAHLGAFEPRWDLLSHFAPIWLGGALLGGGLAGLAFRGSLRAVLLGLGAVGVASSLALIAPEFLRDTGPKAADGAPGQIKVIHFNVWFHNTDPEATVDWLVAQDPDIVAIDEPFPSLLELIKARTDWRVGCADCEVVILSKHAPLSVERIEPPDSTAGPMAMARFPGYTVLGTHHVWPTDPKMQRYQEARVKAALDQVDRDRAILTGDFNSASWSYNRRAWDKAFGLIRRERALFSWPAQPWNRVRWLPPILPIDHVYAGRAWATVKVVRGPRLGSDHYPVVMTLAPVAPR